jgi:SRSO17 transposase
MRSKQYLSGLMQARRTNMERMAAIVPQSDEQALHHFLSNSNWDARAVLEQVAMEADALLGGTDESALLIDESGITKKGDKSVGVARQWNGRLGKVDNCQVGV